MPSQKSECYDKIKGGVNVEMHRPEGTYGHDEQVSTNLWPYGVHKKNDEPFTLSHDHSWFESKHRKKDLTDLTDTV